MYMPHRGKMLVAKYQYAYAPSGQNVSRNKPVTSEQPKPRRGEMFIQSKNWNK